MAPAHIVQGSGGDDGVQPVRRHVPRRGPPLAGRRFRRGLRGHGWPSRRFHPASDDAAFLVNNDGSRRERLPSRGAVSQEEGLAHCFAVRSFIVTPLLTDQTTDGVVGVHRDSWC